jgi:hypothetical protein
MRKDNAGSRARSKRGTRDLALIKARAHLVCVLARMNERALREGITRAFFDD